MVRYLRIATASSFSARERLNGTLHRGSGATRGSKHLALQKPSLRVSIFVVYGDWEQSVLVLFPNVWNLIVGIKAVSAAYQPFLGKIKVLLGDFEADIAPSFDFGYNGHLPGTQERIKHQITPLT